VLLAAFAAGACDSPMAPKNTVAPDDAARKWAENLKIPVRGTSCTTVDSDSDGYVSCVLAIDRGHDPPPAYQGLQCAELGTTKAGGCKPDSKNPKVDIVEWATPTPCPTCPSCPACPTPPAVK